VYFLGETKVRHPRCGEFVMMMMMHDDDDDDDNGTLVLPYISFQIMLLRHP